MLEAAVREWADEPWDGPPHLLHCYLDALGESEYEGKPGTVVSVELKDVCDPRVLLKFEKPYEALSGIGGAFRGRVAEVLGRDVSDVPDMFLRMAVPNNHAGFILVTEAWVAKYDKNQDPRTDENYVPPSQRADRLETRFFFYMDPFHHWATAMQIRDGAVEYTDGDEPRFRDPANVGGLIHEAMDQFITDVMLTEKE